MIEQLHRVTHTVDGNKRSDKIHKIGENVQGVKKTISEAQTDATVALKDQPIQTLEMAKKALENRIWEVHEDNVIDLAHRVNAGLDLYNRTKRSPHFNALSKIAKEEWLELEGFLRENGAIK